MMENGDRSAKKARLNIQVKQEEAVVHEATGAGEGVAVMATESAPKAPRKPGCDFAGLPPALVAHLTKQHSWPTQTVHYGKVNRFEMPMSEPRCLLLGEEEDDLACLLVLGALGAAAAMSVVCIREAATPRPRYSCRMLANSPSPAAGSREDFVQVDMKVKSSTSPGAVVAVDEGSFLTVPPKYLVGAGPSKKAPLNIRIDKIYS